MNVSDPPPPEPSPLLLVLSGPSGVGKDAVLERMREQGKPFHLTVTATTRRRRMTETDGVDYIFVSWESFQQMIKDGEFLEWAKVYGNLYGVPKAQVVCAFREGRDVIIKTDVQGAATIKKLAPEGVFIFLTPPSIDELEYRLSLRMSESSEALQVRLRTAEAEMEEASKFDYVVTNHRDRLDETVAEFESIVAQERRKTPQRKVVL